MSGKIENAISITKELINVISQEDHVKKRCQELEQENEGFVMLIQIHNIVREYGKLAEEVKDNEFNELKSINQIRGMLVEHQSWFTRRFIFKEMKEQTYNLVAEAKQILSYLKDEERESYSDLEIIFTYKGSKWTYGELLVLEDNEAITNYSEITISENDTYLADVNIMECVKGHCLSEIEDTLNALDEISIERYDRSDIREILADYNCNTILQRASDFMIYEDRDEFNSMLDETWLVDVPESIRNYFDYNKYWHSEARFEYYEATNGTIFYSQF